MGRYHYWLVAQVDGKTTLIYGAEDEAGARQRGLEMLSGIDFQIKRLPTRSLPMASSLLKGNRLEQTHSLREATERLRHEKGLSQLRRRIKRSEENRRAI